MGRASDETPRFSALPLVQREVGLLLVLSAVSLCLFLVTRTMAGWQRVRARQEAAVWFQQAEQLLHAGQSEDAVIVLRRATAQDRNNAPYALELARALVESHRDGEAKSLLVRLRELRPDDAEINGRLARLVARTGDPAEAIRYYNLAIYSLTPPDPGARRQIRLELAAFLVEQGDRKAAVAELTAIGRDAPDETAVHLQLADLFAQAGDDRQVFDQFAAAAKRDPASVRAASGAGHAALRLHAYADAERYLRLAVRLGGGDGDTATLEQARLVVATDPFARGLTWVSRTHRLDDGLSWAIGRLSACPVAAMPETPAGGPTAAELVRVRRGLAGSSLRDPDELAKGVALVVRATGQIAKRCGSADPLVSAWQLIAETQGASLQ